MQSPNSLTVFFVALYITFVSFQIVMPDARKHLEDKAPNSDFSHISLLENEKLLTLTNLEDTSGTIEWLFSAFPLPLDFLSVL